MNKLTHSELAALITARPGAFPIGILAETNAHCVKKDRETGIPHSFGEITKLSYSVPFTGGNYENAVKREGNRQGGDAEQFKAAPLPKDREWVPGWENKILRSKADHSKLYLRTQTVPKQRLRNKARILAYRAANGQFIKKEEVKPFLPVKSISKRQLTVGVGEHTGEQVDVRDFLFSSIRRVKVTRKVYEIV